MVNYGLKDKVALITGANNPQGIGTTTASKQKARNSCSIYESPYNRNHRPLSLNNAKNLSG